MRRDVTFMSKGLRCAGWLYVPDDLPAGQRTPAIVMAHGFSGVKEDSLPAFAEKFVAAGLVTLVFDYRFLGASEGEPRGQIIWYEQIEDYRNAITWLSDQPEVNPNQIGVWGTSFSGGHVLHVGAYDKRVKAVVSQVYGGVNAWDLLRHVKGAKGLSAFLVFLLQDRIARYRTGAVNYLKVVASESEPSALYSPDAYEFFMSKDAKVPPSWKNQVTIESLEKMLEYDLTGVIQRVSPTPLLMILAEQDSLIPIDMARKVYERALEPKSILTLPCGHFDVYHKEPWFSKAVGAAIEWFKQHLR